MKTKETLRFNIHIDSYLQQMDDADLVNLYDKVRMEVEARK